MEIQQGTERWNGRKKRELSGCAGAQTGRRAEAKGMAEHAVPGSASPESIQGKPQDRCGRSQHVGLSVQGRWKRRRSRAVPVPGAGLAPGSAQHAEKLSRRSRLAFNSFQRRVRPRDTVTRWPAGRDGAWGMSPCPADVPVPGSSWDMQGWAQAP